MKIKGEGFNITTKNKNNSIAGTYSDEFINQKYLRGEIRIITEQARYPLDTISQLVHGGKYKLNPEYQRRKRWDVIQKSKLIESFIINIPIPPIFLYEVEFASYEVMDGLQRLTAIDEFYSNKFELDGLEEWKELNGKTYEQLPTKVKEGIDRRYLSSIVLLNETAKTTEEANFLKQLVFGRLNSGGDKLTPQESRNALYSGKFNNLCIKLSYDDNFRKLWNLPLVKLDSNLQVINNEELLVSEAYRKMEDVELVLRFFAFRHYENLSSYRSQEIFLDDYLFNANKYSDKVILELERIFKKSFELAFKIFGKEAFYMPEIKQKKTTPTKTVYDSLMYTISCFLDREQDLLAHSAELKSNKFKDKQKLTIIDKDANNELFDGKYNSKSNVEARINYFNEYIAKIIK